MEGKEDPSQGHILFLLGGRVVKESEQENKEIIWLLSEENRFYVKC